jgi:hypothetical protein
LLLPFLLIATACLLAACSDDDVPAASSDAEFAAEAQRLVPGAVLTPTDLEGFEALRDSRRSTLPTSRTAPS